MINRAMVILSLICVSLLSFHQLDFSNSNPTLLSSPPAFNSNFRMNSIEQTRYAHSTELESFPCPVSGGVILYRNANFDCAGLGEGFGYVFQPNTGWENVPESFNDQASSLRMPSGWSVKLYEYENRTGASICRNVDDNSFAGDYFDGGVVPLNDRVDSFEVFGNTGCGGPSPVRVTQVWTGDGSWNPKTTFNPGDPIQWVIDIENLTGALATIDVTYEIEMGNGDTINYWHGLITTSPGTLSWGLPGILPSNRGGTHIFTGSVTYQVTPTQDISDYTLTGPYVDSIFSDGFERGDFSKWSARKTDNGNLAVTPKAALKGTEGMRALIDDNNSIYVTDVTPYRDSKYRVRFYFDPNSIAMQNLDSHRIFSAYDHTESLFTVLRLELRSYDSAYQVRAGARNDNLSTWTNTNWFTISDELHYFEIFWQAASSPGTHDGVLNLWIDGVMRASRKVIDNDTFHVDEIRLGAVTGIDSGTRGTYYFDAFKSTHTTGIGAALADLISEIGIQVEDVISGPPVSR